MKNEMVIFKDRIKKLEDMVVNTNNILSSLLEYQVALESNLQEIIESNKSLIIAIKGASKIDFIPINEIVYCSASLSYTEIITLNNNKVVATKPINEIESELSTNYFFRISKSLVVNTNQIHSYNKRSGQILMKNNDLLDVARRRKSSFLSTILPE